MLHRTTVIHRSKMGAFALIMSLIFVGIATSGNGQLMTIRKCCPKGMQFDLNVTSCIYERNQNISNEKTEILYHPINYTTYSWIPDELRQETLVVSYGKLSDVELDVSATYACNDLTVHRDFPGIIHRSFIQEERYCYDSTPNLECLIFKSVMLKPIHKCCAKGELLNITDNTCVVKADIQKQEVTQEILLQSEFQSWHPLPNVSQNVFNVQYNALKSGFKFNIMLFENTHLSWSVWDEAHSSDAIISYRGVNDLGNVISGSTDIFCFDKETSGTHVLLTTEYHIPKCCGKNEQLSDAASACQPLPRRRLDPVKSGILNTQIDLDNVYWVPRSFPFNHTAVRYDTIFKMSKYSSKFSIFSEDRIFKFEFDKGSNLFRMTLNGTNEILLKPMHYCFDNLIGSGTVMIVRTPKQMNSDRKCSFPTDLSRETSGKFVAKNYPFSTLYRNERLPLQLTPTQIILPLSKFCKNLSDETHFNDVSVFDEDYEGETTGLDERNGTGPCGSWDSEIPVKMTLPSCAFPRLGYSVAMVRAVGSTAAAALAAAAAVVAMSRRKMRSLAHGRALACHALCLAGASVLQVAALFKRTDQKTQCVPYLYATHFFMVSGNWWLTAITFNIYQTFRKPLGEMAAARNSAVHKRRFTTMSLIAWGGSATCTLLSITMHQLTYYMRPRGVLTPNFIETWTCAYESEFYTDQENSVYFLNNQFGPVSYHCVPTGVLAAVNAVLVVLTAWKVQALRRGTVILRGRNSSVCSKASAGRLRLPSHVEHALLYVKLLMTAGVAELSMEAATWATGSRAMRHYTLNQTIVLSYEQFYKFSMAANILDIIRAVCVFWMSTGRFWRAEKGRKALSSLSRRSRRSDRLSLSTKETMDGSQ